MSEDRTRLVHTREMLFDEANMHVATLVTTYIVIWDWYASRWHSPTFQTQEVIFHEPVD